MLRPVPGHWQAFVLTFVTNVVERWLAEIGQATRLARPIPAQYTSLLDPPRARFSLELLARFLHDPS